MRGKFWRFIAPKPLHEEEQASLRASMVRILTTSMIVTGLMSSMGLIYHLHFTTSVAGSACAVSALLFWLLRRGNFAVVRAAVPVVAFSSATIVMLTSEGLHDEGVLIYPLALAFAGLLWGKRGLIAYAALIIITVSAIGMAEITGILNMPFQRSALYFLHKIILLDMLIGFTAATLYLTIDTLIHSVEQARCLSEQAQHVLAQRIRAEEENLTILKTTRDGFSLIDKDGRFLEVNDAYCRLLGYRRDELLQMTIASINPTYRTPDDAVRRIVQVEQSGSDLFETQLRRKDGQIISVEVSVNALDIAGGRFFAFIRDITARKQEEQALQQAKSDAEFANRSKTDFLYSVSHELRTPLNHILGYAQLLENQEISGSLTPKQARSLQHVVAGGNYLLSLIDDVLTLSRLDLEKQTLSRNVIPLRPLLEKSLISLREKDVKPNISFAIRLSPKLECASITADPGALKQILFQLLSNAVKFTPDGGTITLGAAQNDEAVVISIIDSGIGIEPEQQARIFENFYQVKGGLQGKTPGTGLGLPIARRLVELHGGQLWVESAGAEQGSCFSFSLPQTVASIQSCDLQAAEKSVNNID